MCKFYNSLFKTKYFSHLQNNTNYQHFRLKLQYLDIEVHNTISI